MATVHINDPQNLISQAEGVLQFAQNILRVVESLKVISSQVGNAWQSDTVDKESYLSSLNQTLDNLESLVATLRSTGNVLIYYARQQLANANNSS